MGDTQEVIYENTSTSNYNDLAEVVSNKNTEIIKNAILSIGYLLFAIISLYSLRNTHKDPILLFKNSIFCIAFFGISYTYMVQVTESYTGDIDIRSNTSSVNQILFFNICAISYGLLSIFYKDPRYHMNVFFSTMVAKPTLFGIELDGLLAFVGHILLLSSYVLQNTYWFITVIAAMLFVISHIIAFVTNLKIDHVKYKLLYYSILIGSILLGLGYSYDIALTLNRKLHE